MQPPACLPRLLALQTSSRFSICLLFSCDCNGRLCAACRGGRKGRSREYSTHERNGEAKTRMSSNNVRQESACNAAPSPPATTAKKQGHRQATARRGSRQISDPASGRGRGRGKVWRSSVWGRRGLAQHLEAVHHDAAVEVGAVREQQLQPDHTSRLAGEPLLCVGVRRV